MKRMKEERKKKNIKKEEENDTEKNIENLFI